MRALLVLLFVGGAAAQGNFTCDDTAFFNALTTLQQALNLTAYPYTTPEAFRTEVENRYQTAYQDGLRSVCKAFREFKQTMGFSYRACVNPSHLVVSSMTIRNAYIFVTVFNTIHYTCAGGFQTYLSNEACMTQAWRSNADQLRACRYRFEEVTHEYPDEACFNTNTYLTCFENAFRNECGVAARDAQFWGCEYARVGIFTRFPQCGDVCTLPTAGGNVGK